MSSTRSLLHEVRLHFLRWFAISTKELTPFAEFPFNFDISEFSGDAVEHERAVREWIGENTYFHVVCGSVDRSLPGRTILRFRLYQPCCVPGSRWCAH